MSQRPFAACLAIAVFYGLASSANAYDVAGHHYVITAIVSEMTTVAADGRVQPTASFASVDEYKRLQAFCVELPDLAPELDALTQRFRVYGSWTDWGWGAASRCNTPVTRHMVATQWYVHGLTGLEAQKARDVASLLIADRMSAARAATNAQDRVNLVCEAGFGLHLLGDTFAHAQLSEKNQKRLYAPGNGHWLDKHVPDDILSRSLGAVPTPTAQWQEWVQEASKALGHSDYTAQILPLIRPILVSKKLQGDDYGETQLRDSLRTTLPKTWEPYGAGLETWRQENAVGMIHSDVTCNGLIRRGVNGQGIQPVEGEYPNCDAVWTGYLAVAMRLFKDAHLDPVLDGKLGTCDATGDRLSSGTTD